MTAETVDNRGSVAPKERVNIVYRPVGEQENDDAELPLKLLVLGEFRLDPDPRPLEEREIVSIDKRTFDSVLKAQGLRVVLPGEGGTAAVEIAINSLEDFGPDAVTARIPELAKLVRLRKALFDLKKKSSVVPEDPDLCEMAASFAQSLEMCDPDARSALIDARIAQLDKTLSARVNAVLHHPGFQRLESAWRSLHFLVSRTDLTQNIRLQFLNISMEELRNDFEDTPEINKSGLYRHVYTAEYGQFGGKPYGAIIGNYDFGPGLKDIRLLQQIASVASLAHAPFLAGADKAFFGIKDWATLPNLKDIRSVLEMPQYAAWHAFRESEDARYVGLCLPGFLLRTPYGRSGSRAGTFLFTEETFRETDFCWANTAFALALCLAGSFARYRWCVNIVGPDGGGLISDLPSYLFEATGRSQARICTRVAVSESREYELTEAGFICLCIRPGTDDAIFFSANSVQAPRRYANNAAGREAEMNFHLSTQLPYMMIMNRLAHYIKVIQRENIGTWKERLDLEKELNKWIGQYVTEMDNPDITTRSRRPLRMAHIAVNEVPGNPGWYSVTLKARPHFKYMGANFTLSLVGKLDRE